MSAKRILVISILALFCFSPMQGPLSSHLQADDGVLEASSVSLEILMMGNSYTSANSLDSIIDGVMSAASNSANVTSLTGGGMSLSQHSSNVASSGHQWNTTLNNGVWDWVILQDQSQIPGFPRSNQEWNNSKNGAVQLAQTIDNKGADSVLMMTWGRRDGDSVNTQRFPDFSTMQDELEAGYLDYRDNMSSHGDVWVAPVGLAFEHIHDKIVADGGTPTDSGTLFHDLYSSDGSHPSISGSYLAACVLYATITGDDPVGLSHSTSLSNSVVLELQQAASATVFNETTHIDYPWQINSGGGGNQNPPVVIPANQTFAWESVISMGSLQNDFALDVQVSPAGNVFILGVASSDFYINPSCSVAHNQSANNPMPFVAKFDRNGTCIWTAEVDAGQIDAVQTLNVDFGKIAIDSNENVYLVLSFYTTTQSSTSISFGTISRSFSLVGNSASSWMNTVAKIDYNGSWEWVVTPPSVAPHLTTGRSAITIDPYDNLWIAYMTGNTYEMKISKYNTSGVLQASSAPVGLTTTSVVYGNDLDTDSFGNVYLAGTYANSVSFVLKNGTTRTLGCSGCWTSFIAKYDTNASVLWVTEAASSTSSSYAKNLELIGDDEIFVVGEFYSEMTFNGSVIDAGGSQNGYLAKINSSGSWQWGKEMDCSSHYMYAHGLHIDSSKNIYVTGYSTGLISFGNGVILTPAGTSADGYVAKFDHSGQAQWAKSFGGSGGDKGVAVHMDNQIGRLYVVGSSDGTANIGASTISTAGASDLFLASMSKDYDGDEIPDIDDNDDDGDFIHDPLDSCPYSPLGFRSTGSSDHDSDGCDDDAEDEDDDNDQLNDTLDNCPKGMTGWIRTNASDLDDDGCMDALEDYDDDNDGIEDYEDYCSRIHGNSTMEFEKGCPDTDGDGRPDILDPFPNDASEWKDTDGDGVGDNSDAFPLDAIQQSDTDGDNYGDEEFGNTGDSCPEIFGNSTIDRYGCLDTDGDGWSDAGDDFPNNPEEYLDTDGDNVPNHLDQFPFDPTQQTDSDGDGYGDNRNGNLGDAFPNDPTRHSDSDRDGIDDGSDAFPYDPTQTEDRDGDGMGDNPMGIGADKFPDDVSQWGDIDGDGYGDNQTGTNPDAFPTDATQWSDSDGDGYGDNPAGRLYDLFPENPTQWLDEDGDGFGDNLSGTDADPYLNDFDNDGYNDSIDPLPKLASPGDLDNDGCPDANDSFPDNARECKDSDGDGIGDVEDPDDDNDGWADTDEARMGTDSFSAADVPVEGFEVVFPIPGGGAIGLGAWDLIGMFGGVPLFTWLAFCFVTRGGRSSRFEELLKEAPSREALAAIARSYELSLMLRLIGPHQGIRLERMRAELDDSLESRLAATLAYGDGSASGTASGASVGKTRDGDIGASIAGEVSLMPQQPDISEVGVISSDGYEWIKRHDGASWYRVPNRGLAWSWWND